MNGVITEFLGYVTVDVVQTWKCGGAHNLTIGTMRGLIFYRCNS